MNEESRPARRLSENVSATDSSACAGWNVSAIFLRHEDEQLYRLVGQAFELKGSPYYYDAIEAIVDWIDQRLLRRLEHKQEEIARFLRLVSETDPDRIRSRRKAA
jgi:hypothetical protein